MDSLHRRAKALFLQLIDPTPADAERELVQAARGDAKLERRVRDLLAAHRSTRGLLPRPAPPPPRAARPRDGPRKGG